MNGTDKKMGKKEYNTGERVEYICSDKYTLDPHFSNYLTCEEGEWKGNIKCLSKYEHYTPYTLKRCEAFLTVFLFVNLM